MPQNDSSHISERLMGKWLHQLGTLNIHVFNHQCLASARLFKQELLAMDEQIRLNCLLDAHNIVIEKT